VKFRTFVVLVTVLSALPLSGCASRYQDLLKDRDQQIRELQGNVAQLKAANEDLERQKSAAAAEAPKNDAKAQPAANDSQLGELRRELDGTDVRYVRGHISIGIEDSVTFDSGSVALKDSSHKILQKVASVLRSKYPENRIYVEGHTDSDPIQKTKDKYRSNRHLSAERADAVAAYLIEHGVPEQRIVVVGFGQYDPKVQGAGSKARNRRVEIVVGERM
jgi:flagellar motor protein MotB